MYQLRNLICMQECCTSRPREKHECSRRLHAPPCTLPATNLNPVHAGESGICCLVTLLLKISVLDAWVYSIYFNLPEDRERLNSPPDHPLYSLSSTDVIRWEDWVKLAQRHILFCQGSVSASVVVCDGSVSDRYCMWYDIYIYTLKLLIVYRYIRCGFGVWGFSQSTHLSTPLLQRQSLEKYLSQCSAILCGRGTS